MAQFANWLMGFAAGFLTWMYNFWIFLLQHVSDSLVEFVKAVVKLFPESCVVPLPQVPALGAGAGTILAFFLQALNWLFPMSYIITVVQWLTCGMLLFILIAPVARWAKLLN